MWPPAPCLAWLMRTRQKPAQEAAARHETVAAACTTAVAAGHRRWSSWPPTTRFHGVLVATNFFGINTIPIALNEADYARGCGRRHIGDLSSGRRGRGGVGTARPPRRRRSWQPKRPTMTTIMTTIARANRPRWTIWSRRYCASSAVGA
ncbi:PPE domain-containing protein [Mycobacterium tuberculosis]